MDNNKSKKTYLCIDLKSFYASVECVERNLDPLKTNLVVADEARTEKTICLAVTPSLKAYGLSGRSRLFEVVQKVNEVNRIRLYKAPQRRFKGESFDSDELANDPSLKLSYIVAPPRMAYYMKYSGRVYDVYLKYISPDDILVYSIDEVFMDLTQYLNVYKMTAEKLAMKIIRDVLKTTGITATAGIGTNMYLAKIAMDITAKKMKPNKDGVRIASLDEKTYRKQLWDHTPLSDFWRVGKGSEKKLHENRLYCMGDIARASTTTFGRRMLKKLFGINAKLLIDHAWGYEPCTISEVKAYVPENNSISSGQVLQHPYSSEKAKLVVREMTEQLVLQLVEKRLLTDQIVLTIGYDIENLSNSELMKSYKGEIQTDFYGRKVPKHAHGTANIQRHTSSTMLIMEAVMNLYDRIIDKRLSVRRITISANKLINENSMEKIQSFEQLDLFTDYDTLKEMRENEEKSFLKERKIQQATINIRNRFGKNAILKGTNLQEGATAKDRNKQIGGHKK